jgi:hypothetical protein
LNAGEGETAWLWFMPPSKPGDLPEDSDGLLSAENGKNAIHPHDKSRTRAKADSFLVENSAPSLRTDHEDCNSSTRRETPEEQQFAAS